MNTRLSLAALLLAATTAVGGVTWQEASATGGHHHPDPCPTETPAAAARGGHHTPECPTPTTPTEEPTPTPTEEPTPTPTPTEVTPEPEPTPTPTDVCPRFSVPNGAGGCEIPPCPDGEWRTDCAPSDAVRSYVVTECTRAVKVFERHARRGWTFDHRQVLRTFPNVCDDQGTPIVAEEGM